MVRQWLRRGNSKLGEGIWSWSLPAGITCPGRSAACDRVCYARRGRFLTARQRERLIENYALATDPSFPEVIEAEIKQRGIPTVRVHVAGDFFDPTYTAAWVRIVRRCPRTRFYAYTRSWRVPTIRPLLDELAGRKNFRLWLSADRDTGLPPDAGAARVAWLLAGRDEHPHPEADLVFRTRGLRTSPATRIGLVTVCASETGTPKAADTTCSGCGRCWVPPPQAVHIKKI